MPPETNQSAGATSSPITLKDGTQLDPKVVKVMKAVRQVETQGSKDPFNQYGDSGASFGAYQWNNNGKPLQPGELPANWKNSAQQHLGDFNAPMTPENQNKVAYKQIEAFKNQGLEPEEIAARWNGASKDPATGKYVYNNPQYGEKFRAALMGMQEQKPMAPTPEVSQYEKDKAFQDKLALGLGISGAAALTGGAALSFLPSAGAAATAATASAAPVAGAAAGSGILSKLIGGAKTLGKSALKYAGIKEGIDTLTGAAKNEPSNQTIRAGQPQSDFSSLLTGVDEGKRNSAELVKSLTQAMNATPTGRVAMQDPNTQIGLQTASLYGYAPELGENDSMDFSRATKQSYKDVEKLHEGVAKALDADGEMVSIQQAISNAKENARKFSPSSEWEDVDKHIDQIASTYEKNFGQEGNISLGNLLRAKSEQGRGQKFGLLETSASKNARKAFSMGARSTIEQNTKHKDLFNRVMKEEENIIKSRAIMKRLNGKKAPMNSTMTRAIAHRVTRDFSIYFGNKVGGPLGAIVGGMMGEYLSGKVDKHTGRSIFDTPTMRAAVNHMQKESPEIYEFLLSKLEEAGEKPTEKNLVNLVKQATDTEKGIDSGGLINLPKKAEEKRNTRLYWENKQGEAVAKKYPENVNIPNSDLSGKYKDKRDDRLDSELKKGDDTRVNLLKERIKSMPQRLSSLGRDELQRSRKRSRGRRVRQK